MSLRRPNTHRLIPSKFLERGDSVLTRLTDDEDDLRALYALEGATNDRLSAESGAALAIGPAELVFGVPNYRVINAAFAHAHPLGSRFNGPERGAWYAAFELRTAQAEVAWHKSVELAEVSWFEQSLSYSELRADFAGPFHDLRGQPDFADCLAPDSYVASQTLADRLLSEGSLGVVYPSVRRPGGTCLACFRPALVYDVRIEATYVFTWSGGPTPSIRKKGTARS
ncbi:MAG: RES family NAD+ phosphorylase [Myxococcota bacterium]